jgi:hypothetical protein
MSKTKTAHEPLVAAGSWYVPPEAWPKMAGCGNKVCIPQYHVMVFLLRNTIPTRHSLLVRAFTNSSHV